MEFLQDFGLFFAKAITLLVALFIIISMIAGAAMRNHRKSSDKGDLHVENLNETFEDTRDYMMAHLLDKKKYKLWSKKQSSKKKNKKQNAGDKQISSEKADRSDVASDQLLESKPLSETDLTESKNKKNRLFVLKFDGDVQASETEQLIKTIDAALLVAEPGDTFFCSVESAGGLVHAYGLAASQLRRIRDAGFHLTVAIDKVAASGGYMMACVADRIIAAPFAIVGSIGVVAQIPNFHRVLQKHNVDVELHTAGEYKRTLTLFGENTDAAREKFREELEETHLLFKEFVSRNRPVVNIAQVATGEHWYGEQAISLQLVDEISTSQDYLIRAVKSHEVISLSYELKVPLMERMGLSAAKAASAVAARFGLTGVGG